MEFKIPTMVKLRSVVFKFHIYFLVVYLVLPSATNGHEVEDKLNILSVGSQTDFTFGVAPATR